MAAREKGRGGILQETTGFSARYGAAADKSISGVEGAVEKAGAARRPAKP